MRTTASPGPGDAQVTSAAWPGAVLLPDDGVVPADA